MKRIILLLFSLLSLIVAFGQSRQYIRADSVYIQSGSNGELIILNSTRDSIGGLLYNKGGGRTAFKKAKVLNDSTLIIGGDTLVLRGASLNNLQKVTDAGNKTTDTIISKALMTQAVYTDTLDEADFEIDVFPDLQRYNNIPLIEPQDSMFNWVRRNRTDSNIVALLQVGDLTDFATDAEFVRVDTQFDKLDAMVPKLRYLYVPGNHDYDANVPSSRLTTKYNTYFGPGRYAGDSEYGNMDGTNDNYFITLNVGSHKYLIIGLEFCPRDTALSWAQKIIDSLPTRETILVTHAYIARSGERSVDTTEFAKATYSVVGNNGDEMWNKLIKKNKQIFMVLNGHFINPFSTPVVKRMTESGDKGNVVYQLAVNYQTDPSGGNGYFMRLKFKPRVGKIDISFYSPFLQQYDTRFPSYSLDYPALSINSAVGVSGVNGSFNVAGESRFDSSVFFTNLLKNRYVKITDQGKAITDSIKYNEVTNVTLGAVPFGGTSNRLTFNTNNIFCDNTLNRVGFGTTTPLKKVDIRSSIGVSDLAAGYPTLLVGSAATSLTVSHGSGNWGFAVTRHDGTNRAPNMVFFTSQNADPTIYSAIPVGKDMGRISFQGVSSTNTARVFGDFVYRATNVTDGEQQGQYLFATGSVGNDYISAPDNIKMLINSTGNVSISKSPTDVGLKLWVNGSIGANKDSTTLLTALTTQHITVWDTVDHKFKRIAVADLGIGGGGASISDAAYDASWNGNTTDGASKNAIYDKIESMLADEFNLYNAAEPGDSILVEVSESEAKVRRLSLTATNGLTLTPSHTSDLLSYPFKLGGTLTENTTITSSNASHRININGVTTGQPGVLNVTTSGTNGVGITGQAAIGGYGVHAIATGASGRALMASALDGTGVYSVATGTAFFGISTSGKAIDVQTNYSTTNSISTMNSYAIQTAGTAAAGIGGANEYLAEMSNGSNDTAARITWEWTNATVGSQTGALKFWTKNNAGNVSNRLSIGGDGKLTATGYGAGAFTGTVAKYLAVTAAGDVIETDGTGGGGGSISDAAFAGSWDGNTTDGASKNALYDKIITLASLTGTETLTNKTLTSPVISSISNTGTITVPTVAGTLVQYAESSITSSATPTPTGDARNNYLTITALGTNATFAAPSGTPAHNNWLVMEVKDDGTSRTLAFNSVYKAGDIPLPTATIAGKVLVMHWKYSTTISGNGWLYMGQTGNF